MPRFQASDTMPKLGHVTDLREQWLVRADGALAHRLQDREISSHLCENRYRNQQIREDFPVAMNEQRDLENELYIREQARRRQADIDAEIAREMAEINLRRQHRQYEVVPQPSSSRTAPSTQLAEDLDPEELGLSPIELEAMRRRLEQEERDARLARELSHEVHGQDALLADMRCAVEAQDGELARLLQEREYKKLQRAKEKAKQKALLKKQQRLAAQLPRVEAESGTPQATLCDAYSNPQDMIRENRLRLCKSVDSDLNYVEPFEKERIESKSSALKSKEISSQYYSQQQSEPSTSSTSHSHSRSFDSDKWMSNSHSVQHRQPPPPPLTGKKPRFPDPVSIRPASHYSTDNANNNSSVPHMQHSVSENNNLYTSKYQPDSGLLRDKIDPNKRLSVISDITPEGLAKKKTKEALHKKRKGCKIQ